MLLEMATPDAIARLPASGLKDEAREIWDIYFHKQRHSSLAAFMRHVLTFDEFCLDKKRKEGLFIQVSITIYYVCFYYFTESFSLVALCLITGMRISV